MSNTQFCTAFALSTYRNNGDLVDRKEYGSLPDAEQDMQSFEEVWEVGERWILSVYAPEQPRETWVQLDSGKRDPS